jgi:hypothetical protein
MRWCALRAPAVAAWSLDAIDRWRRSPDRSLSRLDVSSHRLWSEWSRSSTSAAAFKCMNVQRRASSVALARVLRGTRLAGEEIPS